VTAPTPRRILIVDDDSDIRDTLKEVLEDEGYVVAGAGDGLEALELLRNAEELPGLILLDVMMPRMNGIQFCVERRKHSSWSQIPLIVMSATNKSDLRSERELKCRLYLRKPLNLRELLAVLTGCFDGRAAGA